MKLNPILNFRCEQYDEPFSDENTNISDDRNHSLSLQSTMITKTREAIDSTEISIVYEEMQITFPIKYE